MSMKILSPAGDMESLKMAVFNGADEVYLGVKDFNARNIEGFSLTSLKDAVDFAHVFDVRVFLTVNILFNDSEMQSALDLIVDAYNLGVDAFIIQDVGLASLVHKHYPQIEMHASTQMGLHNLEGVKQAEKLGFKRVVLSRETPLEEIERIRNNSKVELEYFVQGALCVSFSGNCYMSSYMFNASGNRGKCKQLCRLPYTLKKDGKFIKQGYLLSAKDFNMLNYLKELEKAGVTSLKIEGRARRPYYVGVATRIYKHALNGLSYDENDLRLAFNREYTPGYFEGNGNIISNKQNHIGLKIGKVEKVKLGKRFNEIFISSNIEVSSKSTLKIFDNDEEIVLTAFDIKKVGSLYRITTTKNVKEGLTVHLISDFEKEQSLLNNRKRRSVKIDIVAKVGKEIEAWIDLFDEKFLVLGDVCMQAKNQPILEKEIEDNFNKSELFEVEIDCELENIFLTKQQLNQFRRTVFEKLKDILTHLNRVPINKIKIERKHNNLNLTGFQVVENINKTLEKDTIIYSPCEYVLEDIVEFQNKCKHENKKFYLNLPNFALKSDIEHLKNIINKTKVAVVVNNLYGFDFETEKIVGGGMNVYNSYTASYFDLPYIKAEGGEFKMPYMTMRHCPMKEHLKANCANCPFKDGYTYTMESGKTLNLKRVKMSTCTFYLTD